MTPTKELVYQAWAPRGGRWSDWAKPVLFACMDPPPPAPAPWEIPAPPDWLPAAAERAAVVFNLPGDQGVRMGLAAARLGYRPVPLYNALPFPVASPKEVELYYKEPKFSAALVDVIPILAALFHGADELRQLTVPDDAPPVFLLDSNRSIGTAEGGRFDNRSISFTTDFPSANILQASGIHRALLVQPTGDQPRPDLAHTLRRWQESGLRIELKRLDRSGPAAPCDIARPSRFGRFWQRMFAGFWLRSNPLGGYGQMIAQPTEWGAGG